MLDKKAARWVWIILIIEGFLFLLSYAVPDDVSAFLLRSIPMGCIAVLTGIFFYIQARQVSLCPACGMRVQTTQKFCGHCGGDLRALAGDVSPEKRIFGHETPLTSVKEDKVRREIKSMRQTAEIMIVRFNVERDLRIVQAMPFAFFLFGAIFALVAILYAYIFLTIPMLVCWGMGILLILMFRVIPVTYYLEANLEQQFLEVRYLYPFRKAPHRQKVALSEIQKVGHVESLVYDVVILLHSGNVIKIRKTTSFEVARFLETNLQSFLKIYSFL